VALIQTFYGDAEAAANPVVPSRMQHIHLVRIVRHCVPASGLLGSSQTRQPAKYLVLLEMKDQV
jgi:hypothetical protein